MTSTSSYKQTIKSLIKAAGFQYLTEKQKQHSKVKNIQYIKLETQKYMVSPLFLNEDVNQVHALRSLSTDWKNNYKQKYINGNILCSLCQAEN